MLNLFEKVLKTFQKNWLEYLKKKFENFSILFYWFHEKFKNVWILLEFLTFFTIGILNNLFSVLMTFYAFPSDFFKIVFVKIQEIFLVLFINFNLIFKKIYMFFPLSMIFYDFLFFLSIFLTIWIILPNDIFSKLFNVFCNDFVKISSFFSVISNNYSLILTSILRFFLIQF